jgi:TetR/AcrR family transcriptional regulator, transcriptional repressor for nem operon
VLPQVLIDSKFFGCAQPDTKGRLLLAAQDLMLANGFGPTSVDAICGAAKLSKGSFYHFFENKESLALEVLRFSLEEHAEALSSGPFTTIQDPVERALGYVDHLQQQSPALWSKGCLLGSFAMELAEVNPRVQAQVSSLFAEITEGFVAILEPIARAVRSDNSPTARELAEHLLSCLEGSIVLAKAHADWRRIPAGVRQFRRYLDLLLECASATV